MDYQELLFAVAVRKRAVEIWGAQRAEFEKTLGLDNPAKKQKCQEWDESNPKSGFIKIAYNELVWVAEKVREIRGSKSTDLPAQATEVDNLTQKALRDTL